MRTWYATSCVSLCARVCVSVCVCVRTFFALLAYWTIHGDDSVVGVCNQSMTHGMKGTTNTQLCIEQQLLPTFDDQMYKGTFDIYIGLYYLTNGHAYKPHVE